MARSFTIPNLGGFSGPLTDGPAGARRKLGETPLSASGPQLRLNVEGMERLINYELRWLNSAGAYSLLAAETLDANLPTHSPSEAELTQIAAIAHRHFRQLWKNHLELGASCISRYLEKAMVKPGAANDATFEVTFDSCLEIVEDLRRGVWGEFDRAAGKIRVSRPMLTQVGFSATVAGLANLKYKHLVARLAQTKQLHLVTGKLREHVRELTQANLSGQELTRFSQLEKYTSTLTKTIFDHCDRQGREAVRAD